MSLRRLADCGRTVILSIHQPNVAVFNMFDQVVLLAGGRLAYQGGGFQTHARSSITIDRCQMVVVVAGSPSGSINYFSSLGFPIPEFTNPCEFFCANPMCHVGRCVCTRLNGVRVCAVNLLDPACAIGVDASAAPIDVEANSAAARIKRICKAAAAIPIRTSVAGAGMVRACTTSGRA